MRYIVNGQFAQVTAVVNGKEVDVIETILRQQQVIAELLRTVNLKMPQRNKTLMAIVENNILLLDNDVPGNERGTG